MFELPEILTFVKQMNATLQGKHVAQGRLGNSPHKFVWYNRTHDEFSQLTAGKGVGEATARGRWLLLALEPGYVLVLGECGGRVLYHPSGNPLPPKYHLLVEFSDGSAFSVTTQMWGAMELYTQGQENERQYIKGMRTTPVEPGFTQDYFNTLIENLLPLQKRSVKALLTQDQLIPGLGNAIAQDILFHARLDPRRAILELDAGQRRDLYHALMDTVQAVLAKGGRYDELDLYSRPGGYIRLMDKNSAGKPCPTCSTAIQKIQYLGGACYYCPKCQK